MNAGYRGRRAARSEACIYGWMRVCGGGGGRGVSVKVGAGVGMDEGGVKV